MRVGKQEIWHIAKKTAASSCWFILPRVVPSCSEIERHRENKLLRVLIDEWQELSRTTSSLETPQTERLETSEGWRKRLAHGWGVRIVWAEIERGSYLWGWVWCEAAVAILKHALTTPEDYIPGIIPRIQSLHRYLSNNISSCSNSADKSGQLAIGQGCFASNKGDSRPH